jgi:hypothetical protein
MHPLSDLVWRLKHLYFALQAVRMSEQERQSEVDSRASAAVFLLRVLVFHFSWPPDGYKGLVPCKTHGQKWL